MTVTAGTTYNIRAYSDLEANEGTHNLILRVTFTNYPQATSTSYPKAETEFTLEITPASCDCALITWDKPE